jgi:FAD/FMN-containing dehydrogenase
LSGPNEALELLRKLEASLSEAVESFELVPREALDLVLAHIPGARPPLVRSHAWNVLVEVTAPLSAASPDEALGRALAAAMDGGLIEDAAIAASETQADAFWRLRESISEAEAKDGPAAKHDISVEIAAMPGFMIEAASAVEARFAGTKVIAFGHLGDGNVHFNVRAPENAEGSWLERESPAVTRFVHDLVIAAGGSISAEHGIGQMRLAELARTAEPVRLQAMRAIKRALDPNGIMNPGKLVPPEPATSQSLAEAAHPQ